MKSLLEPSPLAPEEDQLRATAIADLDALRAAEVATNGLGYLIEQPWFEPDQPGVPPAGYDQERTLVFIGTIALRAARALITLVCSGYEEEAFIYLRILAEAKGRALQVVQDDSGEYARQWLDGKGGKAAKANPELPQDIWTGLSASAHVDVASVLRSGLESGRGAPLLRNGPYRLVPRANATLALGGGQAADVMFWLAHLRGTVLPDEEEFIQLVKTTLETYAPGEDAEAWTSGEGEVENASRRPQGAR